MSSTRTRWYRRLPRAAGVFLFALVTSLTASNQPATSAMAASNHALQFDGSAPAAGSADSPATTTFALIGDFGVNDSNEQNVADIVAAHGAAFVVTVGDNIYGSSDYPTYVGDYYGAYIGKTPKQFFPALGNHDLDDVCGSDCDTGYLNYFGPTLPGPGVASSNTSGSNHYYDFIEGQVHFFMLDTEHIASTSTPNTSGVQYLWLESALQASNSPYNIVIVPQTPYSSSALHQGVGPDGGASLEYLQWPFEAWGATAVFSGDEHNYERLMRDDNSDGTELPYIVTGNGGRVLAGFDSPAVTGSQTRLEEHGAVIVTVDSSGITFDEYTVGGGSAGTLSDTVSVAAPPPAWTAYIDTITAGGGSAANVLTLAPPNGTTCSAPCDPFPTTDTFALKDNADGSTLPVSVQVDASVDVVSNNPTSDPFTTARGDESSAFGGIVSGQGAYSFTNAAGHKFDMHFTGLDDTKTYTVVVGSDRFDTGSGNNQYRWSQFQLTGASAFTQSATTSGNAYIVDDAGASVAFDTGNNTAGYVARWTGISPVGGTFSIVTNYYAGPTNPQTSSYPPSALMIEEEGPAPVGVPGAPTGVSAVAGDAAAQVSWTAPASDGGSAITGYTVTPYIGGAAQTPVDVGAILTTNVTGLTNGTAYTFTVLATNAIGDGPGSAASNAITPMAPPPPWTAYIDTITAGGGSAANVLTLTPPNGTTCSAPCDPFPTTDTFALKDNADGSTLPVSVQVDASVDVVSNNPTSDPFTTARGDESSAFGGIVSGQGAYSFTNAAGHKFDMHFTGLDDTKTYTVVVGSDRFDTGSGNNQYRWSQFQLTGASAFTQSATTSGNAYIVDDAGASVAFDTGNNTAGYVARWTGISPVGGTFSIVTNYYAGPTNPQTSSYPPSALMIEEEGPAPVGVPGAPTGVSAVAGDAAAQVSWTAPASDGGSAITGYTVTPYIGGAAQTPVSVGGILTTDVTGLTNGTAYTFTVLATNAIGDDPDRPPRTRSRRTCRSMTGRHMRTCAPRPTATSTRPTCSRLPQGPSTSSARVLRSTPRRAIRCSTSRPGPTQMPGSRSTTAACTSRPTTDPASPAGQAPASSAASSTEPACTRCRPGPCSR